MIRAARAATEADHLAEQPQGAEGPAAVAAAVEPMVAPVAAPVSAVGAFAHDVVVFGLPSPGSRAGRRIFLASGLQALAREQAWRCEKPAVQAYLHLAPQFLRIRVLNFTT